jgi:hypothetical protein
MLALGPLPNRSSYLTYARVVLPAGEEEETAGLPNFLVQSQLPGRDSLAPSLAS